MFKLTYVIYRAGHPQHIPLAVSGRNGMPYGHAIYDARYQAHVFRFTKEQWEGTPGKPGAMKEVLKRANRGSAIWMVLCEVEIDAESPVGQLATELDAARAELEDVKRRLEATQKEYEALSNATLKQPEPAPSIISEAGLASFIDHHNDAGDTIPFMPEAPPVESAAADSSPPASEPPSAALKGLRFNELQDRARAANERGAQIPLESIKTKVGLIAAVGEWLDSQSAEPATAQ